jgi:DNA-binding MarR family transcriptional regulator
MELKRSVEKFFQRSEVKYGLEVLLKPKAAEIMMAFVNTSSPDNEKPQAISLRDLARMVGGSNTTLSTRLNDLMHAGLLTDRYEDAFHGKRYLVLTELGFQVVVELWKLDMMIFGIKKEQLTPQHVRARLKVISRP